MRELGDYTGLLLQFGREVHRKIHEEDMVDLISIYGKLFDWYGASVLR